MFFGANVDTIPHVGRRIACLLHEGDICVHLMQPAPWFLLMVGVPANHFHHSNVPLRLHGTLTTTLLSSEAVYRVSSRVAGVDRSFRRQTSDPLGLRCWFGRGTIAACVDAPRPDVASPPDFRSVDPMGDCRA